MKRIGFLIRFLSQLLLFLRSEKAGVSTHEFYHRASRPFPETEEHVTSCGVSPGSHENPFTLLITELHESLKIIGKPRWKSNARIKLSGKAFLLSLFIITMQHPW
jgi:hypothetical protein